MEKKEVAPKKSVYRTVVAQISGIFFPIIGSLTGASMIKSVIVLLSTVGVLSVEGGLYRMLYAVSDGFFYFLPFFLAYTASRQWNTDRIISLLIPVAMLYPEFTQALESGEAISFLGLTLPQNVYHSSVIPVLLAIGLLHFVEKPCDKYLPEAIRGFMKPIVCCLVVLPVTFLVFGKVGTVIGDFLTQIFFALYAFSPVIAGLFMGFFIQPMVVVGAHWSIVPVSINSIAVNGYDIILPLLGGAVYGQAGACLAMAQIYRIKQLTEKKRIAYQAALSSGLGVTEPALFGITSQEPRAMLAACIAGAVGGGIAGAAGTHCSSFAFPSYVTCVAYIGPGFWQFLVSMAISFVLGFFLTFLQKKYF